MTFTSKTRYVLISAAIVTASIIQFARGYRLIIVLLGASLFLLIGNLTVYLSMAKERAQSRQRKRDYYANGS